MEESKDDPEARLEDIWGEITQIAQELSSLEYEAKRAAGRLEAKKEILSERMHEFTELVDENPELGDKEVELPVTEEEEDMIFSLTHEDYQRVMEIIEEVEEDYEKGVPIKLIKEMARDEDIDPHFAEELIKLEMESGKIKPARVKNISGTVELSKS